MGLVVWQQLEGHQFDTRALDHWVSLTPLIILCMPTAASITWGGGL
ncbi:unnamed protein product [Staurois parvus]|uniref:Uncharacterized protein n=1 Tax=Staurois parvus TaxID=386267 RepID=A0ABN9BSW6_9NEOB|nr:unnamed protein product [Staurois parvus]